VIEILIFLIDKIVRL